MSRNKLQEYLPQVEQDAREAFVESHAQPFLVLYLEESDSKPEWSFKTDTISSRHIKLRQWTTGDGAILSSDASRYRVFELLKAAGSPWVNRISVGRARNNDIVLPHKSVSKLHAHFSKSDNGGMTLSDAGSRNGTRINSQRILDSNPVSTSAGDLVTFGAVSLTHFDAGGLYDLVKRLLEDGS